MTAAAIPEGSVIITPVEQYAQQQKIAETLQGVSTKLDAVALKLDHYQEDQERRITAIDGPDGKLRDLETRTRSLERFRWISAGVAAAISSGTVTALVQTMSKH